MAATGLVLPTHFGLAALSVVGIGITMMGLGVRVGGARKRCGVGYPLMYADEKSTTNETQLKLYKEFNGWQRGHQNAVESYGLQLAFSIFGALKHPLLVVAGNALWCVGRIMYQSGYATQGPNGRGTGAMVFHIGELIVMVSAISFALGHLDLEAFPTF